MSRTHADSLSGKAAIVGIGATEFSKNSGRSELQLAVEAIKAALDDAGLSPKDVDGLSTFTMENNPEIFVAQALGFGELTFFSRIHYGGGGGCGTIQQAAMAVNAGVADCVVCYRAFNERSGFRLGSGGLADVNVPTTEATRYSWVAPFGLRSPASWAAMFAMRYLHDFNATTEAFGEVAVQFRQHAATNPLAHFYKRPITMADHQASPWISEPMRLLDCCQETDGGQAIVVTTTERARTLRQSPAVIAAAAQGSAPNQHPMSNFYRPDLNDTPEMGVVSRQLWRTSGLEPRHIDVAMLYDHFIPLVLMQMESLGFCGLGEAKDFVKNGNLLLGGALPTNTNGGQIGEGYLHGMNGIAEGVRQIRGTAVNQVPGASRVLVTAGTSLPTSGLILTADG